MANLAVIGAGRWGQIIIKNLLAIPEANLLSVVSSKSEIHNILPENCQLLSTWEEVLINPHVEGVIIASPPSTHTEIAIAAIEAGKSVFIEKPMSLDRQEAERLLEKSENSAVAFQVNHIDLYNPAWQKLREEITEIGEVLKIKSVIAETECLRANNDIPTYWEYGVHFVACCIDVFLSEPDKINIGRVSPEEVGLKTATENVELYKIVLRFGKCIAEIICGTGVEGKHRKLHVRGDCAELIYDDRNKEIPLIYIGKEKKKKCLPEGKQPLRNSLETFCISIGRHDYNNRDIKIGFEVTKILKKCDDIINQYK